MLILWETYDIVSSDSLKVSGAFEVNTVLPRDLKNEREDI